MTTEYDVGYGKPPKQSQFKPGESGNPAGRPKSTKNLSTDLEDELGEKVLVTEGSKQIKITKQRAMVKSLMAKALKGDVRAVDSLIKLIQGIEERRKISVSEEELQTDDSAILAAFKDELLNQKHSDVGKGEDDE